MEEGCPWLRFNSLRGSQRWCRPPVTVQGPLMSSCRSRAAAACCLSCGECGCDCVDERSISGALGRSRSSPPLMGPFLPAPAACLVPRKNGEENVGGFLDAFTAFRLWTKLSSFLRFNWALLFLLPRPLHFRSEAQNFLLHLNYELRFSPALFWFHMTVCLLCSVLRCDSVCRHSFFSF